MSEVKFKKRVKLNEIEKAFSNGLNDFRSWLYRQPPGSTVGVTTQSGKCPIATYVISVFGGVDRDVFLENPGQNWVDTHVAVGQRWVEVGLMNKAEAYDQRQRVYEEGGEGDQTLFRKDMPRWAALFVEYIDYGGQHNATREECLLALNHAEDRIIMENSRNDGLKYIQGQADSFKRQRDEVSRELQQLRGRIASLSMT